MSQYSSIYAFGDSLSDAGNDSIATGLIGIDLPVSPPYYNENYGLFGLLTASVFSNGPIWVQDLAQNLGLSNVAPSLYGGNDFAYGGAEATVNSSTLSGLSQATTSLTSQLAQFAAGGGGPSSALYTVSIGTNDVVSILGETGVDLTKMMGQVADAVSSEVAFISSLIDGGAKSLLALDTPDVGKLPVITEEGDPAAEATATKLSNLYDIELNTALEGLAKSSGVTINILPLFSLLDEAVASPSSFGLTNATDPAWTGNLTSSSSGTVAASPNTYLFWDSYHPTATGQSLIAADAQSLVTSGVQLYTAPAVQMTDATAGANSTQYGTALPTPTYGLQGQFLYPGTDSVAIKATTPNMFLHGGPAGDALQAIAGSNILDGGTGSNFLVGATGADGGADIFFADARSGGVGWDTLVNFHPGDTATLWGFQAGVSSYAWDSAVSGAEGYTGATLRADVQGTGSTDWSITFAGLSVAQAQGLQISTGSVGTSPYLLITDPRA